MAIDLTDLSSVKSYLNVTGSGEDTKLGLLIDYASQLIESYLDRYTESAERTEYLDVEFNQQVFSLRGYPVDTGETVTVTHDTGWDFAASDDLDSDDFTVLGNDGLLNIPWFRLTPGPRALKVVYTGGMAANTAAFQVAYKDIELAAIMQVAYQYRRRKFVGDTSSSIGGSSVGFDFPALLPEVELILRPHRRRSL